MSDTRSVILDNRPSLNPEAEIFPREDWHWYIDETLASKPFQFQPVPGTWWNIRKAAREGRFLIPKLLLALIGCPSCKQAIAIMSPLSSIDNFGKVTPDVRCGINSKCEYNRQVYLDKWNDKPLYCIVFEDRNLAGELTFVKRYCHATTRAEAIEHYGPAERRRIFDVAPAVGYKVLDKHGEKLSAD
jgi:hypothetical protein